mgnify:CR=1 FL=1
MSHLGPWFERPQNRQYRIVCVPLLPPISSPNEWGCSNRLGRASLLPRIPAFALEHGLTWIGAEPIQREIGAIFTHRWCDSCNSSRCG